MPVKIFVKDKHVIASPYKPGLKGAKDELASLDDLKKVHHQVNYTNIFLLPNNLMMFLQKLKAKKGRYD